MQLSLRWTSKQDRLTRTTKQVIGVVPSIKEIPMCYLVAALIPAQDTEQAVCLLCSARITQSIGESYGDAQQPLRRSNGTLACSPKESGLIGFKRRQVRTSESTTR
jgi:hypothetical protein